MNECLQIYCDEAGHTGSDLLNSEQRIFSFASVAITDAEASEIIERARRAHPLQMPELKSVKLMKSSRGKAFVSSILEEMDGRFAVNAADKLLAIGMHVFLHIYGAVFAGDPSLLYKKGLHVFVAALTFRFLQTDRKGDFRTIIHQFQNYMRNLDKATAPFIFERTKTKNGVVHPFDMVIRFAQGYRNHIVEIHDVHNTPESLPWTLDLSGSALYAHLNHWGNKGQPLCVTCDESKPLRAAAAQLESMGGGDDLNLKIAHAMTGHAPSGWTLAESIKFGVSQKSPSLQLADIVAGTVVACLKSQEVLRGFEASWHRIRHHMIDNILFDPRSTNLNSKFAAVNFEILSELAQRAERGDDPHANLAETYQAIEDRWDKANGNRKTRFEAND